MTQYVFVHGPGAGGCGYAYENQLRDFPGSVAPTLPGHLEGSPCPNVATYAGWLRGWLWAQGLKKDLVLVGYTLGASIGLQYGLDYPEEVKALALMSVAMRPKDYAPGNLESRLEAAKDPAKYDEWFAFQRRAMEYVEPGLRERLMERHRQVGPLSQYHDLATIKAFDVRNRIHTLKLPLLLLRGMHDGSPMEYEQEIHAAVPSSRYVQLKDAGHFPIVELPDVVGGVIKEFIAGIPTKSRQHGTRAPLYEGSAESS